MESIRDAMTTIDKLSGNIPEGDYLALCNNLKDIHSELNKNTFPEFNINSIKEVYSKECRHYVDIKNIESSIRAEAIARIENWFSMTPTYNNRNITMAVKAKLINKYFAENPSVYYKNNLSNIFNNAIYAHKIDNIPVSFIVDPKLFIYDFPEYEELLFYKAEREELAKCKKARETTNKNINAIKLVLFLCGIYN